MENYDPIAIVDVGALHVWAMPYGWGGVSRAPARVKKQALAFVPPLLRYIYIYIYHTHIYIYIHSCWVKLSYGPKLSDSQLRERERERESPFPVFCWTSGGPTSPSRLSLALQHSSSGSPQCRSPSWSRRILTSNSDPKSLVSGGGYEDFTRNHRESWGFKTIQAPYSTMFWGNIHQQMSGSPRMEAVGVSAC